MLRANLSTRPFYNERLVRATVGAVAIAAFGLATYDGWTARTLLRDRGTLAARADEAEARARALAEESRAIRRDLAGGDVEAVRAATREANALIERRAFSWTDLFSRFESTLPADVRVVAVQPQIDGEGRLLVVITAVSRRVEDVDRFIDRLEGAGGFAAVLSRQEEMQDDGTLRSVIQGYYAAAGPPGSSESGGGTP